MSLREEHLASLRTTYELADWLCVTHCESFLWSTQIIPSLPLHWSFPHWPHSSRRLPSCSNSNTLSARSFATRLPLLRILPLPALPGRQQHHFNLQRALPLCRLCRVPLVARVAVLRNKKKFIDLSHIQGEGETSYACILQALLYAHTYMPIITVINFRRRDD